MSYSFSSLGLNFNQILPVGRSKRAFGTLFLVAALIAVSLFVVPQFSRAGVPTFSGGGPGNGQVGVPPDALIDIVASEAITEASVVAGDNNVALHKCTGATDALTCTPTGSDATTNLCTSVTLSGSTRITCGITGSL